MDQDAIIRYIRGTFMGAVLLRPTDGPGAGDTFVYYDPQGEHDWAHQLPFATLVTKDYSGWDESSQLNRPEVFRLNIGVSRDMFRNVVGYAPGEATAGTEHDPAALDRLMPHPTYATQSWVCVLNPSEETFEALKPLLADAFARAASQHKSKRARKA